MVSRYQMDVQMRHGLSGCGAIIYPYVVCVRVEFLVQETFGLIQEGQQ